MLLFKALHLEAAGDNFSPCENLVSFLAEGIHLTR